MVCRSAADCLLDANFAQKAISIRSPSILSNMSVCFKPFLSCFTTFRPISSRMGRRLAVEFHEFRNSILTVLCPLVHFCIFASTRIFTIAHNDFQSDAGKMRHQADRLGQ